MTEEQIDKAWTTVTGWFKKNVKWEKDPALRRKLAREIPSIASMVRKKHMSMKQLAEDNGFKVKYFCNMARGSVPCSKRCAVVLAETLGVKPNDILRMIIERRNVGTHCGRYSYGTKHGKDGSKENESKNSCTDDSGSLRYCQN